MSPPVNDQNLNLVGVVLCAGKGTRLGEISTIYPKPLIESKSLGFRSILRTTIESLHKLKVKEIIVVVGHLAEKVQEHISEYIQEFPNFKEILKIIDARPNCNSGPLYSFLEFTKDKKLFQSNRYYLVIPGDTYFEFESLKKICDNIKSNRGFLEHAILIFYRKVLTSELLEIHAEKEISVIELEKRGIENKTLNIGKVQLKSTINKESVNQMIPIFIFSHDMVKKIKKAGKGLKFSTLREVINDFILRGEKYKTIEITDNISFYDIDYREDLDKFLKLKKKGRQ